MELEEYKKIKVKKPIKHIESEIQQACVKWFNYFYPKYKLLLFKIHNEGAKTIQAGALNKREGLLPGVADIFLAVPHKIYLGETQRDFEVKTIHGLFIEIKTTIGKQSPAQIEFQKAVEGQGYKYVIVRSSLEFEIEINNYLK